MKDLDQNLVMLRAIKPDAHATGTITGTAVDTKFARNAVLVVDVGDIGGGGTVDIVISDCETSGGTYTTHTTVAQIDADGQTTVDLRDFDRYIKAVATVGTNAVDFSALFVCGNLRESKNLIS